MKHLQHPLTGFEAFVHQSVYIQGWTYLHSAAFYAEFIESTSYETEWDKRAEEANRLVDGWLERAYENE